MSLRSSESPNIACHGGYLGGTSLAFVLGLIALAGCSGEKSPTVTAPEGKPAQKTYTIAPFLGQDQRGPAGEQLPLPITVQVTDETGKPTGGASLEFTVASGGGSLTVSTVTTDSEGRASTAWRLGWSLGQQTLWVHAPTATAAFINAEALVNPRADVAIVRTAASFAVTVLLLGDDRSSPESRRVNPPDSVVHLAKYDSLDSTSPGWMAAFSIGAPPAATATKWTPRPDTITLEFALPYPISLTVWVLESFEANGRIALRDVEATAAFWRSNPWGLTLGDVRIIDATQFANSPVACSYLPAGPDPNTINIYYGANAQIGSFGGFACSSRLVLIRPQLSRPGQFLLAHELGHTFGLGHVQNAFNFMHPSAVNSGVTTGQIFNAHFYGGSAINSVYGFRPASALDACCILDTFDF